jgi:formylglycine-generating enzyme required for sulfatase activity
MKQSYLEMKRHIARVKELVFALLAFLFLVSPIKPALANDIQIPTQTNYPFSGGTGEVGFDMTWSNSWRSATEPYNWDAAWVFCKIRINGGNWTHLKLDSTGHTIPSGFTSDLGLADTGAAYNASTNPYVGVFLYRSSDGFGTATLSNVRLRWNYADNGAISTDSIDIRVIAVEMVYIPQASFSAGDTSSTNTLRNTSTAGSASWSITSEAAITTSATSPYYYTSGGGGDASGSVFTIPAIFPKGYAPFYMMKGEISQSQWVTFFNLLTTTQQSTRDITGATGKNTDALTNRNNVSWVSGDATLPDNGGGATYSGVAMNFISWADVTAYLDWAGLRPMSELEYEKAGRGPNAAVSGAYAWGSTSITGATTITNIGLTNERGQTGSNCAAGNAGGVQGPLRVGSFAQGVATRVASGGGFYGAMELSGNLYERTVTVGSATGRAFDGAKHGNGILNASGDANVTSWPGTTAVGTGFRGGSWNAGASFSNLSDRSYAAWTDTIRYFDGGGRGVRSILGTPVMTGGTESTYTSGGMTYRVHQFTSSATATVIVAGNLDYLIVGGGGGGNGGDNNGGGGGGGGGGGVLTGLTSVAAQTYTITVGNGGVGGIDNIESLAARQGGNSSAFGITATGGGGGARFPTPPSSVGASGGSGGGGFRNGNAGGAGTAGQGNNGGAAGAVGNGDFVGGGGGGGAGGVGGTGVLNGVGGTGGNGIASSITGSSVNYGGGGAGGSQAGAGSAGGTGGGGAGGATTGFGVTNGTSGTANTGGGGGGGGRIGAPRSNGGQGGSGVVIVRYRIS